jgi:uncharacterized protein (DUF2236 family)
MQLAHPLIARGVAEHSGYRSDRLGRLLRTLRPMYAIAFGTPEQAHDAARRVNLVHERVRGPSYNAADPDLLGWVLATLIDSALVTYRRFVGPLSPYEEQRYYEDMRAVGALLQMPGDALPLDLPVFHTYVEEMVSTLAVAEEARSLARELFEPLPGSGPLLLFTRELTAGLLPPRLRRQYGLSWGPAREAALEVAAMTSRTLLPFLPPSLRRPPWFLMPAH